MPRNEALEDELTNFRDKHLESRRDVNIYRNLKKYSKVGIYTSGFLIYITLALYFSDDFSVMSTAFIGFSSAAVITVVLTILFRLNRRRYDFNEYDLVYHEIAALIDSIQHPSNEDNISAGIERFQTYVIDDDDGIIPRIWKAELGDYLDYMEDRGEEELTESFSTVFHPFINTLNDLEEIDLQEKYKDEETPANESVNQEPGFVSTVIDSISSDVVSKEMMIWAVFILAVGGGLVLAFVQGQGWGVLLVTIVFGGLRLYDQQRE